MNKSAITPLISTVVLVIFAVGVGVIIMSWGNQSIPGSCDEVKIDITKIADAYQICQSNNFIFTTLENNGVKAISNIKAELLGEVSTNTRDITIDLVGGTYKQVKFDHELSKILKIRIVPYVQNTLCIDNRVEIEDIGNCK